MKFDIGYLWSPKYAKWIILSVFVLLSLLMALEIVSVFTFRHQINTSNTPSTTPIPATSREMTKVEHFDTELFGTWLPPNMSSADIKESKLNLEVVSILFSRGKEHSLVIIRSSDGEEHHYKTGDTLPGSVIIKSIMADGVLVEHNGALESLRFPEETLQFEPPPKPLNED